MNEKYSVDVIIPFRDRIDYDVMERIEWRSKYILPNNFHYSFIDYGSSENVSRKAKKFCLRSGFNYYFFDSRGKEWNASKARNIGIINSSADFIFFEDLDLISDVNFYERINIEIESLLIEKGWDFFVVPVSYLKEGALNANEIPLSAKKYSNIVSDLFESNKTIVDFHADASSYLMVRREKCLEIGGYDERYEGWGFEDSDFWVKLLTQSSLDKPRNFFRLDTRPYSQQVQWSGWRALFRVHADLMANKGIYSFHVWHPIAEHRNFEQKEKNRVLFNGNAKEYFAGNGVYKPISINNRKTIFFDKNPHSWNNCIFSYFDDPILYQGDLTDVLDFVKLNQIEFAVFNNPYGEESRLQCYKKLRSAGVKCYVIERGALPWSIYIDEGGFCAESKSYARSNWECLPFGIEESNDVKEYIQSLKLNRDSLEPQNNRKKISELKIEIQSRTLGRKKVLFVALQSPSDTTTNYFCGKIGSYDNFINEIRKFIDISKDDCLVIYKNHPLTLNKIVFSGGFCVDEYHINDILEICDCVTLINSGVGVLSIIYEKPVYYFGEAFYANPGLNGPAKDAQDLRNYLANEFKYDSIAALKFIWFLKFKFYSFARWDRQERRHTSQANLSISKNIKYNDIKILGEFQKQFHPNKINNIKSTILFDRYRLDFFMHRNDKKETRQGVQNKKYLTNNKKINKFINDPDLFFFDLFANMKKKIRIFLGEI